MCNGGARNLAFAQVCNSRVFAAIAQADVKQKTVLVVWGKMSRQSRNLNTDSHYAADTVLSVVRFDSSYKSIHDFKRCRKWGIGILERCNIGANT